MIIYAQITFIILNNEHTKIDLGSQYLLFAIFGTIFHVIFEKKSFVSALVLKKKIVEAA